MGEVPLSRLRNVDREVSDALEIGVHFEAGDDGAEIDGDRLV